MPAIVLEAEVKLLNFGDVQKAIFFSTKKFKTAPRDVGM